MTAPNNKPVSDEDLVRFREYRELNPVWGSLHNVLEDGNITDDNVQWCIDHARETGDTEGIVLGEILLRLSKSQRLNLPKRVGW